MTVKAEAGQPVQRAMDAGIIEATVKLWLADLTGLCLADAAVSQGTNVNRLDLLTHLPISKARRG